jgi:hypothetical protein
MSILQFKLNQQALQERLNPGAALASAGDCGANCMYVLGKVNEAEAIQLSATQNAARAQYEQGHGLSPVVLAPFLFGKYLFDSFYDYDIVVIRDVPSLIAALDELKPGYGTVILMNIVDEHGHVAVGHYIIVEQDLEGNLTVKDVQNSTTIERMDLMGYFSQYNMFSIPSINKKHARQGEAEMSGKSRKFAGKKSRNKNKNKNKKTKKQKNKSKRK